MSKLNKSKGNMYKWVTHTWSPIRGCPHQCGYCYVKSFRSLPENVVIDEPFPYLGSGRVIFVAHMGDLFAENVEDAIIKRVIDHCQRFENEYVFQSKNPRRVYEFCDIIPANSTVGTTIETDQMTLIRKYSNAPEVIDRALYLRAIKSNYCLRTFLTLEPLMMFNLVQLRKIIAIADPDFINIGADSKNNGLPEPKPWDVMMLLDDIKRNYEVREKHNLERLLGK